MKIINASNNEIIADKVKVADNIFSRMIGLLGKQSIEPNEALLIIPCKSIHSVGMRFDFDAVFLDRQDKVVFVIENMKPGAFSKYVFAAHKVMELASGTVKLRQIQPGDHLEVIR